MSGPNFDVGRYGLFVWGAYGVSALVLIALTVESLLKAARWRRAANAPRPPREAP